MLQTEKEAKDKWCPQTRYLALFRNDDGKRETAGSYNRGAEDTGLANSACLASGCAMWREKGMATVIIEGSQTTVMHGYCGLAGKPE